MEVLINGDYKLAKIGLVKGIQETSIIFDVEGEDIEINVDQDTLRDVKDMNESEEIALLPIDIETRTILFHAEPIEDI